MASKLKLTFTSVGIVNQTITLFTGATYTFKDTRQSLRQVALGYEPALDAQNFLLTYNQDDNYLETSTTTYERFDFDENGQPLANPYAVVTIENPDNTYFTGFDNSGNTFITASLTTTEQAVKPTLDVVLGQSPTDACGRFNLNIQSNVTGGRVTVEIPVGNKILDITTSELPYNLDRVRPSLATGGVVKLFETEFTADVLKSVFFTAPGVLSIKEVKRTGSPFGAIAEIIATGSNLQYSLDNVSFQGSKEYTGLLAGNHTAYVKDSYGCTKSLAFTVTEEQTKGLTADPYIRIPIHNSLRFADRNGESFLNYLGTETPGYVKIHNYAQDYLVGDTVRTQFKSSYSNNKAYLIDETGAETEIAIIKKSNNISRINIYEGNYAPFEGRLSVYFSSGNIYNPDGSIKDTHSLRGLLPGWYEEGMYVNIEGVGVTSIERITFDETTERTYAITQLDSISETLSKKITSIHTAHPYEVYEFDINFSIPGKFQVRINYGTEFFLSEIIKVSEELDERYLTVQWYNESNNDILYNTGIKQLRRLEWEDYFSLVPKAEIETYDTDTSVEKINSKTFAVYSLSFTPMPMELARGIQTAFDNSSSVVINGVKFVAETPTELERLGQWYLPKVELTLTDQVMDGQQTIMDAVMPQFLQVTVDPDGKGYLLL